MPTDTTHATMTTKSQLAIERLLTTSTCTGPYCTGGDFSENCPVPEIRIVGDDSANPLLLPLDDGDVAKIKKHAERAGVGLPDRTVVNLDVRKTWQLKPNKLSITNMDKTLNHAVGQVSRGLGTATDYTVNAHLYKLLLYEPGCFFLRHRDNERLDGMFGTLIIELPSVYQGAELSVWSPLTPKELQSFAYGDTAPRMHYTAFYADCYHEVSNLTSGHRAALVYHLTAQPRVPKVLRHLPDPSPSPPQPAEEQIAQDLADLMYAFGKETVKNYPKTPRKTSWGEPRGGIKPNKFAIVLSHHYTPRSLTGLDALKGSDRAIEELIRAAAWCRPSQMDPSEVEEVPYFDAVLSLAVLWDQGEVAPRGEQEQIPGFPDPLGPHGFRTTGPLVMLSGETNSVPLNMGPPAVGDMNAEYDPSWFKEGALEYHGMSRPDRYGNHSLPIYAHELLFSSEGVKEKFFEEYSSHDGQNCLCSESPKEVEFLGNGCPYEGRWYSRSVILIWPKEHREAIEFQSKGGRAVHGATKRKSASKKQKRSA